MSVQRLQQSARQSVLFQQPTEFQQRDRIRRSPESSRQAADRLQVAQGIFHALIPESEALLDQAHPQYPFATDR